MLPSAVSISQAAAAGVKRVARLSKRRRFGEFLDLGRDMGALVLEEILDRAAQRRIGDVMRRIGRRRQIAARDLVLACAPASTRASLCSMA